MTMTIITMPTIMITWTLKSKNSLANDDEVEEEGGRRREGGEGGGETVNPFAALITSYDDGVEKEGGRRRRVRRRNR